MCNLRSLKHKIGFLMDLSADVVSTFVRYGKHSMPFFRKTEISDEELKYLGAYLSRNYK